MAIVSSALSSYVDMVRINLDKKADETKSELGQFFSSLHVARLMASMMDYDGEEIRILDPGAGIGSLFAACVDEIVSRKTRPEKISVTAYEVDSTLFGHLESSLGQCEKLCEQNGIGFSSSLIREDFIKNTIERLQDRHCQEFTHIILNPPYKKINTFSDTYKILKSANLQSTNQYTAFISLSERVLKNGGEMVFISPRSFCNGPYFQQFRRNFLESMSLQRIHIFDSRSSSFRDDEVLQENIIIHAKKAKSQQDSVTVSSSSGPEDEGMTVKHLKKESVMYPDDPQHFIHVVPDEIGARISNMMRTLGSTLHDLGMDASTGKIVDFRIRDALRHVPDSDTAPLIHPFHLSDGKIVFPVSHKKENYVKITPKSRNLLVENGNYVLVKRFSSKEERRRITASVWDQNAFDFPLVGFENRINYFHCNGKGIKLHIARGLALFLNSTIVDLYFRQFNGHTQVNATDLRYLRYPTLEQLGTLADTVINKSPNQQEIDDAVERVLFNMSKESDKAGIAARTKIDESISILKQLGFPKQQQNDRSGLTLLALLSLKPEDTWSVAKDPLMGITPMMKFFELRYGIKYAPNTRETVRRQTVHQFSQASLVVENPDNPKRPTNSGKTVYQIEKNVLKLIKSFGSSEWNKNLKEYKKLHSSLQKYYDEGKKIDKISLAWKGGKMELSPGKHNKLVVDIVNEFAPRFIKGGRPLLIGDTAKRSGYHDKDGLKKLGIVLRPHGKQPDVVIYDSKNRWLFVIEAVTSHGPIEQKRKTELEKIFSKSRVGIVYVTAFLDKKTLKEYIDRISWKTEVWTADHPENMIHFDGTRFLGPYK